MKTASLTAPDADVAGVIAWAWDSYMQSEEASTLNPRAKNMEKVETWLRSNIGVKVQRVGSSERIHQEVWAWYDNDKVYLRADKVEAIPGVSIGVRALAAAWREAGVLEVPADPQNLCWRSIPRQGRARHYRLRLTLGVDTEGEDQPFKDFRASPG